MAAAMAGEDREEEKQGAIRKVNALSYLWYQFTGKKTLKHNREVIGKRLPGLI